MWFYRYFGLKVASEFEFPELVEAKFEKVDVLIRCNKIIDKGWSEAEGFYRYSDKAFSIRLENDVAFEILNGNKINVNITAEKLESIVQYRGYLLSPVFNALLFQRGYLVLHASAVSKKGFVVAFAADSGVGKSTTAAALVSKQGYSFFADDVCAVYATLKNQLQVFTAGHRVKLFEDSLVKLNLSHLGHVKNADNTEKYCLDFSGNGTTEPAHTLLAVVILSPRKGQELLWSDVHGVEKASSLLKAMFWRDYQTFLRSEDQIFVKSMLLAGNISVYDLRYDKERHSPFQLADFLNEKIVQLISARA